MVKLVMPAPRASKPLAQWTRRPWSGPVKNPVWNQTLWDDALQRACPVCEEPSGTRCHSMAPSFLVNQLAIECKTPHSERRVAMKVEPNKS